jgi:molecular chaperone GrpE
MSERPEDNAEQEPSEQPEEAVPDNHTEDPSGDLAPDEEAPAEAAPGLDDAPLFDDAPVPEDAPVDPEAELEGEIAVLKDKLLRALAETENVRRRADRDKDDAAKYAITNFAREMLNIADNLRRAIASLPDEARTDDPTLANLLTGVELTEKEMLTTFERFGIRAIDALGKKIDPNLHEALFEIEDVSQVAGTILQVLDTGYVLKDRLLRPARVGVAKGGPKVAPAANAPEAAEAPDDGEGEGEGEGENTLSSVNSPTSKATAYEKRQDADRTDDAEHIDRKV